MLIGLDSIPGPLISMLIKASERRSQRAVLRLECAALERKRNRENREVHAACEFSERSSNGGRLSRGGRPFRLAEGGRGLTSLQRGAARWGFEEAFCFRYSPCRFAEPQPLAGGFPLGELGEAGRIVGALFQEGPC